MMNCAVITFIVSSYVLANTEVGFSCYSINCLGPVKIKLHDIQHQCNLDETDIVYNYFYVKKHLYPCTESEQPIVFFSLFLPFASISELSLLLDKCCN